MLCRRDRRSVMYPVLSPTNVQPASMQSYGLLLSRTKGYVIRVSRLRRCKTFSSSATQASHHQQIRQFRTRKGISLSFYLDRVAAFRYICSLYRVRFCRSCRNLYLGYSACCWNPAAAFRTYRVLVALSGCLSRISVKRNLAASEDSFPGCGILGFRIFQIIQSRIFSGLPFDNQ